MHIKKPWIYYKVSPYKVNICKQCFFAKNWHVKRFVNNMGQWETHHACKCKWELFNVQDVYWCNHFQQQQLSLF